MQHTRVIDAAAIRTDEQGTFAEIEEVRVSRVKNHRSDRPQAALWRLLIPERFADVVAEAKAMGKPVEITYSKTFGGGAVELIEIV